MKKLLIFVVNLIFFFVSCNSNISVPEEIRNQPDTRLFSSYLNDASEVLFNKSNDFDISSYFEKDWGKSLNNLSVRGTQGLFEEDLKQYLNLKNINEPELMDFLSENPNELYDFVDFFSSREFSKAYKNLLNFDNLENKVEEIYNNNNLTSIEKSNLVLLLASEKSAEMIGTRSLISCARRYAKLTQIAIKSIAISSIDPGVGVKYASEELKKMKKHDKYEC